MIKRRFLIGSSLLLIVSVCLFSQEFFLDIPKKIGFVIEYGRIVRQLKVEKRNPIHDYDGTWSVYQRINAPSLITNPPFEVPTLIRLSNGIILSDHTGYGDICIEPVNSDPAALSELLYKVDEITFCTFPWLFENGTLVVQKSEYSKFLPVFITNLGYQDRLDALFDDLKEDHDTFTLLLDESLARKNTTEYKEPIDIHLNVPDQVITKTVKNIAAYLNEEILLYEFDYGYWNTLDYNYRDSSILLKIQVPGKYRIIFTATGHITYYNLEVLE
ncbi:MAG TPA: hypothetical protein PK466_14030 [Thermotogota bacterium]|nr:hypothetical protein [Thermotogota bacterium]HPJ90224.1 hypothetical protein [Thermotogota bacterium]HPR97445.1 hypothetical protein [Thermotogota bacterium]